MIEKGLCRSYPSNPLHPSATIKYGFGIYGSAHFSKIKRHSPLSGNSYYPSFIGSIEPHPILNSLYVRTVTSLKSLKHRPVSTGSDEHTIQFVRGFTKLRRQFFQFSLLSSLPVCVCVCVCVCLCVCSVWQASPDASLRVLFS